MRIKHWATLGLTLLPAIPAFAGETITYHYDAKGRLTQVAHAGGRNDGLVSNYEHDATDNRKSVNTSGAHPGTNDNVGFGVIVVPLNGLTLIPLG